MTETPANLPDRMLSESEAAHFLGLKPSTLRGLRCKGDKGDAIPEIPYVKLGRRCVRYLLSDLMALASNYRIGG